MYNPLAMRSEGDHSEAPVFFLSNHVYPHFLYPRLIEINKKTKADIVFVCDATYTFFLKMWGLQTLGLDMTEYSKKINDAKAQTVALIGKASGAYRKAYSKDAAVQEIARTLNSGVDVLMFPSSTTGNKYPWRSGVGRVIQQINTDKTHAGFIYMPSSLKGQTNLCYTGTIGSLIGDADKVSVDQLVLQMKKQYELIRTDHNF